MFCMYIVLCVSIFQNIQPLLILHFGFIHINYLHCYERVSRACSSSHGSPGIVPITQTRTRWGVALGLARARGDQEEGEPGLSVGVGAGGWAQRGGRKCRALSLPRHPRG